MSNDTLFPMADFSQKKRTFAFEDTIDRVDLGRCSAYWTMRDGRKCISETSEDRTRNIFETYFFAHQGMETLNADALFAEVKATHNTDYDHDQDIVYSASTVIDDHGRLFWAIDIRIAGATRTFRKRPPFFRFYGDWQIPTIYLWNVVTQYRQAQNVGVQFLVIEGETGSGSWNDRDIYNIIPAKDENALTIQLSTMPNTLPSSDYTKFNFAVIDARNAGQPFNQSVCVRAEDWPS